MISKELYCKIRKGINQKDIVSLNIKDNQLEIHIVGFAGATEFENIYELVHDCKVHFEDTTDYEIFTSGANVIVYFQGKEKWDLCYVGKNPIDRFFKACQWILDEWVDDKKERR